VGYVSGIIQKDRVAGSFINRPMLNLNRPELNLDHRVQLAWSPTNRKSFLTTSKLFSNNGEKRRDVFYSGNLDDILRNDRNNDKDSVEYFQRGNI
jgi:hypothetical protein